MLQEMINKIVINNNITRPNSILFIMNDIEIATILEDKRELSKEDFFIWVYIKSKLKKYDKHVIGHNQLKEKLKIWQEEALNEVK